MGLLRMFLAFSSSKTLLFCLLFFLLNIVLFSQEVLNEESQDETSLSVEQNEIDENKENKTSENPPIPAIKSSSNSNLKIKIDALKNTNREERPVQVTNLDILKRLSKLETAVFGPNGVDYDL